MRKQSDVQAACAFARDVYAENKTVLACDPGHTTGIALITRFRVAPAPIRVQYTILSVMDIAWQDAATALHTIMRNHRQTLTAVVYEEFKLFSDPRTLQQQIGSDMPASQIIGMLKAYAECYQLTDRLVVQAPWERKQVRLQAYSYRKAQHSQHSIDAMCHADYYARTHWIALTQ